MYSLKRDMLLLTASWSRKEDSVAAWEASQASYNTITFPSPTKAPRFLLQ